MPNLRGQGAASLSGFLWGQLLGRWVDPHVLLVLAVPAFVKMA